MTDELTPTDYAFLVLLKVSGGQINNTEMAKAHHGVRLVQPDLARINATGFIDSNMKSRPYKHTLTQAGSEALNEPWAVMGDDAAKDGKERQLWAALAALYASRPADSEPVYHDLDKRIRAAYDDLAPESGAWVSLTRLRSSLSDVKKAALDDALRALHDAPDVQLEPEANQKILEDADRRAAVKIGGEDRHLLAIGMR